jgi:hypothetical protein
MTEHARITALILENREEHHEQVRIPEVDYNKSWAMPLFGGRSAALRAKPVFAVLVLRTAATIALRYLDLICIAAIVGIYLFTFFKIGRL